MIMLYEFHSLSIYVGEDIESSVTTFVNDGFIDVAESEMVMEVESISTKVQ